MTERTPSDVARAQRPIDRRLRPSGAGGAPSRARPGAGAAPELAARAPRRPRLTQPRTMALAVMFVCFAASGALRVYEVAEEMEAEDWRALAFWEGEAQAETLAAKTQTGETQTGEAPAPETAQAKATDQTEIDAIVAEALVAADAAVALGAIETGSTNEAPAQGAAAAAPARAPLPYATGSTDAGEAADLIEALRRREAELDAFAKRLKERDAALSEAAATLEKRMRELEAAKEEFSALVATVDRAAERDVGQLVTMYEKMKPKQAAALFDAMDPAFAAGFLSRMKPDRASEIMAKMNTDKAYQVSLHLAGRNVRRGKEPAAKPQK